MIALAESAPHTLIDELLAEQQSLTAVERFSRQHARETLPAQARYYRDLIPLSKPGHGEQYAFAVDLDICTGCKACVSACHSLNGLDDDETWRDIGLLHGGTAEDSYQQTVTTACHHCVEPACLEGCPVRAYEKDADTGIVRHLDDQCIGCQYCVLKCPYDVPKYSKKRGIVRKCDMCHSRLAVGEAPACVQACPSGAITIRIAQTGEVTDAATPDSRLLPGAFDSSYTKPTTLYTTHRAMPANARPGDSAALRLEHAHAPLIGMLVLTQVAAGVLVCAAALAVGDAAAFRAAQAPLAAVAFVILNVGLAVSILHLGRPLGAWRAFLGLRTSWMSREILAFSVFAGAAAAFTFSANAEWLATQAAHRFGERVASLLATATTRMPVFVTDGTPAFLFAQISAVLGLLGVWCSAMIYVDTRRVFWDRELTFTKFFGTALLLGSAGAAVVLGWTAVFSGALLGEATRTFAVIATLIRTALFGWEFQNFHTALRDATAANHRSALTVWQLRRPLLFARLGLFAGSTLFGILAITGSGATAAVCATLSFFLTLSSQLIERYFFFTVVIAPRMPGPVAPSPTHV